MGAETFVTFANGENATEAFADAVRQAEYDYGHRGYTGTIAEKSTFTLITDSPESVIERLKASGFPRGLSTLEEAFKAGPSKELVRLMVDALITLGDPRIDDKWGPAGCIEVPSKDKTERVFCFFGWASS